MPQFSPRAGFSALLLLTAACSQPPAMVELKGQNSYGRSAYALNTSATPPLYSYANPATPAPAPAYTTASNNVTQSAGIQPARLGEASHITNNSTQQTDGVAWVGVHELSTLSPAAGNITANAAVPATPVNTSSASSTSSPINPWTGKPHFTAAENAPVSLHRSAPQDKPVAQLDRIIGSDDGKAHVVKTAKVETSAFMWPVSGKKIISAFGPKGGGKTNDGINIAAGEGEPVWASADGEIVYVGNELQGYGNMVLIKHPGNKTTAYAHLSRATVDKYDRVKQGDIIGYVGATGNVKEPQLHFAIRDGKDPIDPTKFLSRSVASN